MTLAPIFFVVLERTSPCKVNLLLNILGRRDDGFHELETVMQPVALTDRLTFERRASGIALRCDHPGLPLDAGNLVYRAAQRFLEAARIDGGVAITLEKRLPLEAGLGGGSANAAVTLRSLNELFGNPLDPGEVARLAMTLGSDVPFFLQDGPALATGRGERVESLEPFPLLNGCGLVLVHPGFGVSTAWAYGELVRFPAALRGRPGRGRELIDVLQGTDRDALAGVLYNALETPVLRKYPLLRVLQEFFRAEGVLGTLMSGSGSTTLAITPDPDGAEALARRYREVFGPGGWVATSGL